MSDIVKMLRQGEKEGVDGWWGTMSEAADEIERLRGSQAVMDIVAERERHTAEEGWTPEHDDTHTFGELGVAAACYALMRPGGLSHLNATAKRLWPWGEEWWKPAGRRRNLVKSGALIVAEIERLDRADVKLSKATTL